MPRKDDEAPRPEIPAHLEQILTPDKSPQEQAELPHLPGKCHIHGEVGFGRFIMHDRGQIISEHCAKCMSRVFTAIVGKLIYDDEEDE